jgi:hypothetical protein
MGQSLVQRRIPTLDMGGFSRLFAHGRVLLRHRMTEAETLKQSVKQWPWRYACGIASHNRWHVLRAPIPNGLSHHLSCLAAQSYPHPGVVGFFEHQRAAFVQFQYCGSGILWVRGEQGGPSGRQLATFC